MTFDGIIFSANGKSLLLHISLTWFGHCFPIIKSNHQCLRKPNLLLRVILGEFYCIKIYKDISGSNIYIYSTTKSMPHCRSGTKIQAGCWQLQSGISMSNSKNSFSVADHHYHAAKLPYCFWIFYTFKRSRKF